MLLRSIRQVGVLATRPSRLIVPRTIIGARFNSTATTNEIKTEIGAMAQNPTITETVAEITNTVSPDQIGYFQSLGLAQNWYWPSDIFQHIFEYAHVYTGLPWWATIGVVTVGMRVVMFPMYYKAADTSARFSKLQPQLQEILEDYQKSKDPLDGQKALLRRKKLMAENNVKYRWLMAPMFGAPFFIGIFSGLNRMAAAPVEGFLTQGMYWFQNLSVADPYLGLQVITALIYSATFRLGGEMGGGTPTAAAMKKIMPFLPFIAIPLTMKIPAATCMYFAFNGVLSLMQAAAFASPKVRSAIGLAPVVKSTTTNKESTMDAMKNMWTKMNEHAQEQARKKKDELDVKRRHELDQMKLESRRFIQVDDSIKKTQSKVPKQHKASGKRVKKGKEMRL